MYKPKTEYAKHALNTIVTLIRENNVYELQNKKNTENFDVNLACFVSIHNKDGSLRGCIGTIEPREENLYYEIISNAVSAATKDTRFLSLTIDELENIKVSVDVLSKPKIVKDISKLDVKKFGIIISDDSFNRGVLLPNIEGVNTVKQQINIAKRKAGLSSVANEFLTIYSFTSTRYY